MAKVWLTYLSFSLKGADRKMKYFGLDVHTQWTVLAWTDTETGESAAPYQLATDQLLAHLDEHARGGRIALETGSRSIFLARQLKALDLEVLVVGRRPAPALPAGSAPGQDRQKRRALAGPTAGER